MKVKKPQNRDYPYVNDKSLGAALKKRRLQLKLHQEDVASMIGILTTNYSRFERNIHCPHISIKNRINEFLGYNFWDDGTLSLNNRLVLYRIREGLTANQCGVLFGVSRNTIKRIENKIYVSDKMIKKVRESLLTILESDKNKNTN